MKKRLFSILYMFLITLVFTSMVSAVKYYSQERIERNEKLRLQQTILRVLNIAVPRDGGGAELIRVFEERIQTRTVGGRTLYAGYGRDGGPLIGYAFPVRGQGVWGPISGIVAVDDSLSEIKGVAFYDHSETPGLGGRMTEEWFQNQFQGVPLEPRGPEGKFFYLQGEAGGSGPHELDAITGATLTSRAIETFLNRELKSYVDDLSRPGKG